MVSRPQRTVHVATITRQNALILQFLSFLNVKSRWCDAPYAVVELYDYLSHGVNEDLAQRGRRD